MIIGNSDLPRQRLPRSKKTSSWGKSVIDELESLSYSESYNGRSSKYKKQINFDLYNGKIDLADFEYVINPYGFKEDEFPASFQHYDIISPKLNLLLGEEIKRPFNFRAVSINEDAVTEIEKRQKEAVNQAYRDFIASIAEGRDPQEEEQKLANIDHYLKYSFSDATERTSNQLLNYLTRELSLEFKFNQGFKDALISGEEIYWTGIVSGAPAVRLCNPLDITVIMDPDSEFVDDAQAVLEERWLQPSTIIDEFYQSPDFTDAIAKRIESCNTGSGIASGDINYPYINIGDDSRDQGRNHDHDGTIRVLRCEWKSQRKVGFLYSTEAGQEIVELVSEDFTIPGDAPKDKDGYYHFNDMKLKWYWISEYWEGTKIGDDIYLDIKPKQNQRRNLDNPSICKSSYVGLIYNNRNSESVSLIDRMKPYQYLYDIIYYRLELALAKTKGKVALMDVAQIPGSEGWDVDKWMYYLDAMGIMFVNSMEEGNRGQTSNFNQFQSIDLTMGNYIQTHVALLEQIKAEVGELSGVTRQRLGQVQTSESVGGVERAVSQSSAITEIWFYQHNEVKRRVLESVLDVAKIAYRNGKKINYIADDMSRHLINVSDLEFATTQTGVFIGNTSKDNQRLSDAKQLLHAAMQGDKVKMSEAISVLNSDSLVDIRKELEKGEAAQEQRAQQEQQSAQQMQQQQIQAAQQEKQAEMAHEDKLNMRDNDTKLQIAFSKNNEGGEQPEDKSLEYAKLDADRQKAMDEAAFKERQRQDQVNQFEKELGLKKKDLEIKEKQAKQKPVSK